MSTSTGPDGAAARTGRVLHLADRAAWRRAERTGSYTGSTRGADLADVGYVHMSTAAQLPGVMAFLYADVAPETLVLLVVDLPTLGAAGVDVRWEALDGAGERFPHVRAAPAGRGGGGARHHGRRRRAAWAAGPRGARRPRRT